MRIKGFLAALIILVAVTLCGAESEGCSGVVQLSVRENQQPGTEVGNISSGLNSSFMPPYQEFILLSEEKKALFDINYETGLIRTKQALNRESTEMYLLNVLKSADLLCINITVLDVNEFPPSFTTSRRVIQIAENAPNHKISLGSAVDQDSGPNTIAGYRLVSGNVDLAFNISGRYQNSQTLLLDLGINGSLDYETTKRYTLIVEVYDGGYPSLSSTMQVDIEITDTNDNQPVFNYSKYSASISENTTVGTSVLEVQATDLDEGDNAKIRYSIDRLTDPNEHFVMDPVSGVLRVNKPLDYETKKKYILYINAKDNDNTTTPSRAVAEIDITNIKELPANIELRFLTADEKPRVAENVTVGYYVARISVSDPDAPDVFNSDISVELSGGDGNFGLETHDNVIYLVLVQRRLDREIKESYNLTIRAAYSGDPPLAASRSFTLFIDDVNDNAPQFSQSSYTAVIPEMSEKGSSVLQVNATDRDIGENARITYHIRDNVNTHSDWFHVDSDSGLITTNGQVDCEVDSQPWFVLVATDHGNPPLSSSVSVSVSVRDVNDKEPTFDQTLYLASVPENRGVGNCLLQVNATDPDCGINGQIRYFIAEDMAPSVSMFNINIETGWICIAEDLDFEFREVYDFPVIAKDAGNFATTAQVQITLTDINDNRPVFYPRNYSKNIRENTPTNEEIITVQASDDDSGEFGKVLYSIVSGNDDNRFQIDPVSGSISLSSALPSVERLYTLIIEAVDGGGLSSSGPAEVHLSVTGPDYNPPQFERPMYRFIISEAASEDQFVGNVKAEYVGSSSNIHYSIVSGDRNGFFRINANTGFIYTAKPLDHDEYPYILLNIMADVGNTPIFGTTQANITITDTNDNDPVFSSSRVSVSVSEDTSYLMTIYSAHATDKDSKDNGNGEVRYRLGNSFNNLFVIDSTSGEIRLSAGAKLNYEEKHLYELVITAYDQGQSKQRSSSMTLVIHVQDSNDNAPEFEHASFATSVSEAASVSSTITQIKAEDKDTGENGRITFSIIDSEFSHYFGIFPSDGVLYLKKVLDREIKSQYVIQVKARDHGLPSLSATAQVTIHVLDFNDNKPEIAQSSYRFSIEENMPADTSVGYIVATDADEGTNALLQYQLVPPQDNFYITNFGEILTSRSLDRELKDNFDFNVRVQDSGSSPKASVVPVHVSVSDVNDHTPTIVNLQFSATVDENQSKGIRVVQINAYDLDAGKNGSINYSLLPDGGDESALDYFTIDPKLGWIATTEVLDYEVRNRYTFNVVVYDGGDPSRSQTQLFEINVIDANDEGPIFPQNVSMIFYVVENTPTGSTVGRVEAYDKDGGENGRVSYYIVGGNHFGLFTVDTETGYVYTIQEIDYEQASSHTIAIKAIDNSAFNPKSNVVTIKIFIVDINDNAPKFEIDPVFLKVRENTATGSVIYTFTATDRDSGINGTVRYEIQNPSVDYLAVNAATGDLTISKNIDYEEVKDISFIIKAHDQAPTKESQLFTTLTVMIMVLDENDNAPVFQSYSPFQVLEDEPVGYRISSIIADDADGNVNKSGNNVVSYTIAAGNTNGAFRIDENTGVLTIASELDRETTASYSLRIGARDHGTPAKSSETVITIEILDVNDSPPHFLESTYQGNVKEHSIMETIVTRLSATDLDQGPNQALTYSIPAGIADDFFKIDPVTGLVTTTTNAIDREIRSSYIITAYVQDGGNPVLVDMATIIINVTDINDNAPVFKEDEIFLEIPENQEQETIHQFVAHDADEGANSHVTYSITAGNIGGKFTINPSTGILSSSSLDRETNPVYQLEVTASDGKFSNICILRVNVSDVNDNDPEFEQNLYEKTLPEDVLSGTTVVMVVARDPDEGDNGVVTYSLYNDTDAGQFEIDTVTGIITTKGTFDREKKSSYTFDVQASDGGKYDRRSERTRVQVTIGDINDNSPVFQEVPYRVNVTMGMSSGTQVLTVVADDKDFGLNSKVTYRLSTASDPKALELFRIEESSGHIKTRQSLGLDTVGYHNLKVVASDHGNTPRSTTGVVEVIVTRTGSGDGDQVLRFRNQNYSTTLGEHSPVNTQVITVELENPPLGVTYNIASGNEAQGFRINNNGLITVFNPDPIDYETDQHLRLLIAATSNGVYAYTTVWISLTDMNDNPPRFTQDRYVTKVYEEQDKYTYVMQVIATDADSPGPNSDIRYNIIQGNLDTAFIIDPPNTGIIMTNLKVDYEIRNSYTLVIEAVDNGDYALSSTCTVKISIVDTNDNPPKFPRTHPVNASEATEVGTALALVTANDVDTSPAVMYDFNVDGNPDGMFSIDRFSGWVRLAKPLDHELRNHYIIGLRASDGIQQALTTLTVNVMDENDNSPQFSQQSYQVSLDEGTSPNVKVVQVNATDADAGVNAAITYSLSLAPSNDFYIDSKTGIIYTNTTVVYQPNQAITQLIVIAKDGGSPSLSGVVAVHIQITSVNKYSPVFDQTSYTMSVSEDAEPGMVLEHVSATDRDTSGRNREIDYKIIGGNTNSKFSIDQKLGQIILNSQLDREEMAEYNLNIIAMDRGIPPRNSTPVNAQILVTDVNDKVPYFEKSEYFIELSEAFPSEVGFLNVTAHDEDEGQNAKLYYRFTSGNEEGLFFINGGTGEIVITPNQTLDYEHHAFHKLVVKATDCTGCMSGSRILSNIATVNINVTDVNEYAPEFPVGAYLEILYENTVKGKSIFEAHANDKDGGYFGKVTYYIDGGNQKFSVHYDSGKVFWEGEESLDYETATQFQYRFNITARDTGGLQTSIPVVLYLTDVDEAAPVFVRMEYNFSVPGSAKNGTIIGKVKARDSDGGAAGRVIYQMKPRHPYFDVDALSGEIRVIYDLNKEYVLPGFRSVRDVSNHRSKRAVETLTIEASSGLDDSQSSTVNIQVDVDRTCANCQIQPVSRPTTDSPAETLNVAIIVIIVVSVLAIILVIVIILILLRNRYRAKDPSPSEAPMYDTDDFDTLTPTVASRNGGPPMYNDVVRYTGGHTNISHSHDMSGHSNNSASSGRGSAEDDEDEELAMINSSSPYLNNSNGFRKAMPDSGIQDDDNNSEPSVQNHQDYLARLGIDTAKIDSKAKSGLTHSVESMHQFSDAGGGEGDGLEIDVIDYTKLEGDQIDNEVAMLDKSNDMGFHEPEPHMVGSLSNVINSEEEYSGSYNWDYLLDWGPQYQPLAHVFAEIARLKDDTLQPKKTPVQIIQHNRNGNLNAQVRTVPPPMITDAPPKAAILQPARSNRSSHSSGSNANSTRTSTINTSLPSMPRSPISHESSFTSPALTPSFTPSLSPLATRSPSVSPVNNGRGGIVSQHSSGSGTPRGGRPVANTRYAFSTANSEQELQI